MLSLFSIELTIELIKIDDVDTDEFVDFAYIYIYGNKVEKRI